MKTFAPRLGCAAAAIAAVTALLPAPAHAWWRGGLFVGLPPVVIGPPVAYAAPYAPYPYYYPPASYAPAYPPPPSYAPGYAPPNYAPPSAYAPPPEQPPPASQPQMSQAQPPYGATCYAGVYTCSAPGQTPVGSGCSCPGIGAPSYGVVQ